MQNSEKNMAAGETLGVVFDIQRYSIHDGPGIRTTVFLKGCPLRCAWCQNPESQYKEPEILLNKNDCTGCGRCVAVCPAGANGLSDFKAEVNRQKCLRCGKCVEVCPNTARRLSGKLMSVTGVVKEVLRDRKFYETSGGGVTLSGGEATFQPEFALAIFKECKGLGLHTALETCGYAAWAVLERVLEYVDLVLYDIKHVNAAKHEKGTGFKNDIILENALKIALHKPIKVRVPLIPGFNDSEQDIRAIAAFIGSLPNQVEMDLLTYNPLGEGKYARLGKECVGHMQAQSDMYVETLRDIVDTELRKSRLHVVRS
jgi:pyruvate formate lyase activating enzyme